MISIGDLLDGKYRVKRRLGGGTFGEVFLADDAAIPNRHVAIKILVRPRDGDHSNLLNEMRTLAQFNHRHVVAFYHHFNAGDCLYLVMEFCPAGSLDDWLVQKGHFSAEQVFSWGLELCETLAFVHGKGIVHHDIKPMNILFAGDGTIKLGDFGIANCNGGTLLYIAPELHLREPVSPTDPRVDVYALGLTLLESITGRHPFEDLNRDEAMQSRIAHDFVPDDLPRWVQEILLKATHPTPELRFQTAKDFADAIRARHVPFIFDGDRIKADALARKAEAAIIRRKWKTAERCALQALDLSPGCVAALLAAGRSQLLIRRLDRASEYFSRAVSVNPRTHIQKELGWICMEQGRLPTAISLLTDHLQRNASDFEAYNLLLKCFYLTGRFEAAAELAETLLKEKAPSDCFRNNLVLCWLLDEQNPSDELAKHTKRNDSNPFIMYNVTVAIETPRAWEMSKQPKLVSKLLFEEYRFGLPARMEKRNVLVLYDQDGTRREIDQSIISLGFLDANDIALEGRGISRRHCLIVNYPDDVWLYDLESRSGTFVDGERVSGRKFLDGVHDLRIGEAQLRVAASFELLI